MKVIFLDVDGVLNSWRNVVANGRMPWPISDDEVSVNCGPVRELDELAIGMVRRLAQETGAKIVFESTWRKHMMWDQFGEIFDLPMIDHTDPNCEPKSVAVRRWLSDHPEVTDWVVIDDELVFEHGLGKWDVGLTDEEVQKFHLSHICTDMVQGFTLFDFAWAWMILEHKSVEDVKAIQWDAANKMDSFGAFAAKVAVSMDFRPTKLHHGGNQ